MTTRLTQDFYRQDSIEVARQLIGKYLVRRLGDGTRLSGKIIETEAYLGIFDPAAHSFGGRRTPRTEVMFGEPGISYIYFIYGRHFCFNVVTAALGVPEAVLIRALEPAEGVAQNLANGPGKLCRALDLNRSHNGLNLIRSDTLWIEDSTPAAIDIIDGPRVGIGEKHDAVHWPLRFGYKNHPGLSSPKFTQYEG